MFKLQDDGGTADEKKTENRFLPSIKIYQISKVCGIPCCFRKWKTENLVVARLEIYLVFGLIYSILGT